MSRWYILGTNVGTHDEFSPRRLLRSTNDNKWSPSTSAALPDVEQEPNRRVPVAQ
jgi:hypothetical protein